MRYTKADLRMYIVKKLGNKLFYFDENGILQCISIENLKSIAFKNNIYHYDYITIISEVRSLIDCNNINLLEKALRMLEVGDTMETLYNYLSVVKFEHPYIPDSLKRFVTKIDSPIFTREPENNTPNTFDFIFIDVNIISEWNEDKITYIKKHLKEINQMVLDKLGSNKQFKTFGIPVNFLKVSKLTLTQASTIQFVFELKI